MLAKEDNDEKQIKNTYRIQTKSTSNSEGGVKLGLTAPPPPLQEEVGVQTQRQEVKGIVEVRQANENGEIK